MDDKSHQIHPDTSQDPEGKSYVLRASHNIRRAILYWSFTNNKEWTEFPIEGVWRIPNSVIAPWRYYKMWVSMSNNHNRSTDLFMLNSARSRKLSATFLDESVNSRRAFGNETLDATCWMAPVNKDCQKSLWESSCKCLYVHDEAIITQNYPSMLSLMCLSQANMCNIDGLDITVCCTPAYILAFISVVWYIKHERWKQMYMK